MWILYVLGSAIILVGMILIRHGSRKRTPEEILQGKTLPETGRGNAAWYISEGIIFIIIGLIIFFKSCSHA